MADSISFEDAMGGAKVASQVSFEDAMGNKQPTQVSFEDAMGTAPKVKGTSAVSTYDPREDDTKMFSDPQALLAERSAADPSIAPSKPVEQFALGAANTVNAIENAWLQHPDNLAALENPQDQARIRQLKAERGITSKLLKDIQEGDNAVAQMVGQAVQAMPGSLASLALAPILPATPALGAGLVMNFMLEQSSNFTNRMDQFGQNNVDAWAAALPDSALATGLEMVPMAAAVKYMKGAAPFGKTMMHMGAGEALQEGGTTLFQDVHTNLEGLTNYGVGELAGRAGESAAVGAMMAPMMGPFAGAAKVARVHGMLKEAKAEQAVVMEALQRQIQGLETASALADTRMQEVMMTGADPATASQIAIEEATAFMRAEEEIGANAPVVRRVAQPDGSIALVPFEITPEDEALAAVQKMQMREGLDLQGSTEAETFATELQGKFGANADVMGEEPPVNPDEMGMSPTVALRRRAEFNPNAVDLVDKPIALSDDPRAVGLTLKQAGDPGKGNITAVGALSEHFPQEVYQPVMDLLRNYVQTYMPNARVVLDLSMLPEDTFGRHRAVAMEDGSMIHVITPMDMLNMGRHEVSDPRTAMSLLSAVSHEMGHALLSYTIHQQLGGVLPLHMASTFFDAARTGEIDPLMIAEVAKADPIMGRLMAEWYGKRASILSGKLTANEFVDSWAGLRKLGFSVARRSAEQQSLYRWAGEQLSGKPDAPSDLAGKSAKDVLLAKMKQGEGWRGANAKQKKAMENSWLNRQLTFHEYMAEQFSRAAYQSDALNQAQFGSVFTSALNKLRDMFKRLKSWKGVKGEKLIEPSTTFQEWLVAQTEIAKTMGWAPEKFKLSPAILKKQKAVAKKAVADKDKAAQKKAMDVLKNTPAPRKKRKVEGQVAPPKEVVADQNDRANALELKLDTYEEYGYFDSTPKKLEKARGLLERKQFVELEALLQQVLDAQAEDDREYTSKVLARLPDKARIKRATLEGTYKRQDVKAAEQKLWAAYLAENPTRVEFTPQELEAALIAGALPLTWEETGEYADYGISQITEIHDAVSVTSLLQAPYATVRGSSEHFRGNPNYVAHIRSFTHYGQPLVESVVEIQSDIMQTKPADWELRTTPGLHDASNTIDDLFSDIDYFQLAAEDLREGIQEAGIDFQAKPEENWDAANYYAEQYRRLKRIAMERHWPVKDDPSWEEVQQWYLDTAEFVKNLAERTQEDYSKAWLEQSPLVMKEKLKDLRPTWQQRAVREWLARATARGTRQMRFASADTVTKVEGWTTREDVQRALTRSQELLANAQNRLNTADMSADQPYIAGWEKSVRDLKQLVRQHEMSVQAIGNNPVASAYLPIYNFYAKDLALFLQKEYGAKLVSDKNGNTWWEVELAPAMEKVEMYDTDNPFADRNASVMLDQYAGLTPEELRNPNMLAEAEAGWARNGVESPIFKRWFGESKVLLGGKPRKLWGHGGPMRMPQGTVWTFSSGVHNPLSQAPRGVGAARSVNEYYLKMENPKMVPAEHLHTGDLGWELEVETAKLEGYDGVIFKHMRDPLEADQFVVFSPEQMARSQDNTPAPEFEYDTDSPTQTATAQAGKIVERGWDYSKRAGLNLWAKIADNLVQLQQVAATQPDDFYLQQFVREIRGAEKLKNKLMGHAEDTVKDLMSIGSLSGGDGAGPAVRKKLHSALQAEWKSGELQGTLAGLDGAGNVVWGGEAGPVDAGARALVVTWEIQTGIKLRKFLMAQGVDPLTEAGARVEELYLRTRTVLVQQFAELATSMKIKAAKTFSTNPLMQNMERLQIDQMMMKLMQSPFVPTGNFGNYVLVIQKDQGPVKAGERRFKTVKKQHFESETAFDLAYEKAQRIYRGDLTVQVQKIILKDEERKLPLQMPAEFFERVAASGEFTDEQVDTLANIMQLAKYDKVVEKYERLSVQLEGGNEDFGRVFSDFTWHNANYIWKVRYRMQFGDTIALHKRALEGAEQDTSLPLPDLLGRSKRLRRNHALMENQKNYILEPPQEFQSVRGYISLAYLAFGIKTAAMNASTNLNTLAAVTYEYGEGQGALHYGRALKNWWPAWRIAERRRSGEVVVLTQEQQAAGLEPLAWVMERALEEGIIDQSFAYFLAGQANSEAFMRSMQGSTVGQLAHKTLEVGMMPFQGMEKFNRMVALLTFFSADQAEAKKEKLVKGMNLSYEKAVKRVDQTQNAYDAANRPRLFQGRKAIATMFMSYVQFQTWVMSGGIDKAIRADITAENRFRENQGVGAKKLPSNLRSSRTKLWLMYLILAGPLGLPFFENILDMARWLYRKLWPTEDLEVELRNFIKDMGADPNLVLHGVSHDVWGFNVSGSLGLGRVIPGTDLMNKNFRNAEEFMGSQVRALGGPAGGFYEGVISALMLGAHGEWSEAGKQLPGVIGAVSKSIDAHIDQTNRPTYGVTAKNGKRMTVDLETGEYRDVTTKELVGMAMGFNPTMLAVNREAHYRTSAEVMYWNIRRSDLMDKHRKAVTTQDEEGRLEVQEAVRRFNSEIPDTDLRLTNKDLNDNLRMTKKKVRKAEMNGTDSKMYRDVGRSIQGAYGLRE